MRETHSIHYSTLASFGCLRSGESSQEKTAFCRNLLVAQHLEEAEGRADNGCPTEGFGGNPGQLERISARVLA
jgi:hypothetical protein